MKNLATLALVVLAGFSAHAETVCQSGADELILSHEPSSTVFAEELAATAILSRPGSEVQFSGTFTRVMTRAGEHDLYLLSDDEGNLARVTVKITYRFPSDLCEMTRAGCIPSSFGRGGPIATRVTKASLNYLGQHHEFLCH